MTAGLRVEEFDPVRATEADLHGYYRVMLARQETDRADEPALSFEDVVGRLRNPFVGFGAVAYWVARLDQDVVGLAVVYFLEEESSHIALVDLVVHPAVRRRGIGSTLLKTLLPELRARGRRLVEAWQVTKDSDGDRWASSLNCAVARTAVLQVLVIPETESALWRQGALDGYRLRRWAGAAPDELVSSFADARNAVNDAPLGDGSYQPPEWTVERVRAREAELRQNDVELRAVVAVHEETGQVVGLTELELHPHRPQAGFQRDTAVCSPHRGRGLGRHMKAHMIHWLLADRPDFDRILTTTNAENTHMIRVNHQLGFKTVRGMLVVNRDLAELEADLSARCSAMTP